MENNTLELAKQLVTIPSYVDAQTDERALVKFLEAFFRERLPSLILERQRLNDSERSNLVVRGTGQSRLLVVGHVDTVQPNDGWQTDPLSPTVCGGKLYGLGAADMKGSLAAFLTALCSIAQGTNLDGLMLLLYVDEEYDFKGIKRFLEMQPLPSPRMVLSLDGSLEVASGCRGLVELNIVAKGKTGHSSNPANGVNAIMRSAEALRQFEKRILAFSDNNLGASTVNVAYLRGGVRQVVDGVQLWRRAGNVIADTVEMTVEVRPSLGQLTATLVIKILTELLNGQDLGVEGVAIVHDIVPWPPDYTNSEFQRLKACYQQVGLACKLADRALSGYLDVQMLTEAIHAPAFVIGAGGGNKHGANEYVPLENLRQATMLYQAILKGLLRND